MNYDKKDYFNKTCLIQFYVNQHVVFLDYLKYIIYIPGMFI